MSSDAKALPKNGLLPWTKSCFVCGEANPHGLRLKSRLEDGRPVITYTPSDRDLGWKQRVHGGITMTLLDEVMTWAAILASRKPCVAAEVNSRLRKPVSAGEQVRVIAEVETVKSKVVCTSARMETADGTVLATATGKYMPMGGKELAFNAGDFVEGPGAITFAEIFGG